MRRILPPAALAGLCAVIFLLRLHTYNEPLERDLTTYAVIAHQMLNGKNLYSDLWDHKPPAIHVTYAAAEWIAGYGRNSIFLMNAVAAMATLVACYFAGAAGGRGPVAGLIAATLWTLASGEMSIEGNQPNTEVFLNVLLTTAFIVFVRPGKNRIGFGGAILVGVLFTIASFYKQIVVVNAAFLSVAYFFFAERSARKRALTEIAVVAGIGAVGWSFLFGYFFWQNRGNEFVDAVFTYNRWYSAHPPRSFSELWHWPGLSADSFIIALATGALTMVGLVIGLAKYARQGWALLLAWGIATYVTVQLPGWFFPHYYQLWLPPLVIGAGWTTELLKRTLPEKFGWSPYVLAGACGLVVFMIEIPCYLSPAKAWSIQKYGPIFIETEQLAARVDRLLPPNATFYEWGNETGFYFATKRQPPSGLIFAYPMQDGPLVRKLSEQLLRDLSRNEPELMIAAEDTMALTPRHPVVNWLKQNYRPFWQTKSFAVLVRKGGALDRAQPLAQN